MRIITSSKIIRVLKNKPRLEKELSVKIKTNGEEVSIDGNAEDEYLAKIVIEALDFGFPLNIALLMKEDNLHFDIINIKNHTTSKNLQRVRGRVIGKEGRTLKTLCHLTGCYFEQKDNQVGIIGEAECIKSTREGLISLIRGSKQANVYKFLEKHHPLPITDLGLKEEEN